MKLPRLRKKGHAYYYDTGSKPRKWLPLGSDTALALKKYEALMKMRPVEGTVGEIVTEYMLSLRGKVRESTLNTYRQYERRLIGVFGEIEVNALTPKMVAKYLDGAKNKRGETRVAADNEISLLRAAYSHAMRTRDIPVNPAIAIKAEKVPAKPKRYITDAELGAVLAQAKPLLAVGIELAYATSLRISDILKLRWDDFTENAAIVQQKTGATSPRMRYLLTPELRDLLDRARALQTVKSLFVIATRGGQPVQYMTFWTWWRAALEAAGIPPCRFHDIRRKSATDRDAEGGNAQSLLGHATPGATKVYMAGTKINVVEPMRRRKA